jgi:hypothetical protein
LVHRDLKPDNIFLARPPGGREIAKILDFGIAKALASVGARTKGTRVGTTVGTPLYMAPEQAVGDPDIDARADLYSLGVILYQVLSGRPPFEGDDAVAVLSAVMTQTPTPLEYLCPDLPRALCRLVEAAMNRDRNERPATASDFLARLQAATAGIAPSTSPATATAPYDAVSLSKLDAAVLVDLTGAEIPVQAAFPVAAAAPASADSLFDDLSEEAPLAAAEPVMPAAPPAPAPPAPQARETYVIPSGERAPAPPRARRRWMLWLIPVPVLAAAAAFAFPRLSVQTPGQSTATPAAARPTALVEFQVPGDSQLFLDGSPLVSNPIALGEGEFHTVTAVAGGRVVGTEKFLVDQPRKTIRVRIERK